MRIPIDTLRRSHDLINTKQKCQVDSSCPEMAINICSEQAYRGCTMAYCNNHSGKQNRLRKQCCMFKICARDQHIDICSECSNDILSAQKKFYCMSLLLTLLVFCVLMCLLHVIMQAIPGWCPTVPTPNDSSDFCTTFQQFWNKISIYDRNNSNLDELKGNTWRAATVSENDLS